MDYLQIFFIVHLLLFLGCFCVCMSACFFSAHDISPVKYLCAAPLSYLCGDSDGGGGLCCGGVENDIEEAVGDDTLFDRVDANGDGIITREELAAVQARANAQVTGEELNDVKRGAYADDPEKLAELNRTIPEECETEKGPNGEEAYVDAEDGNRTIPPGCEADENRTIPEGCEAAKGPNGEDGYVDADGNFHAFGDQDRTIPPGGEDANGPNGEDGCVDADDPVDDLDRTIPPGCEAAKGPSGEDGYVDANGNFHPFVGKKVKGSGDGSANVSDIMLSYFSMDDWDEESTTLIANEFDERTKMAEKASSTSPNTNLNDLNQRVTRVEKQVSKLEEKVQIGDKVDKLEERVDHIEEKVNENENASADEFDQKEEEKNECEIQEREEDMSEFKEEEEEEHDEIELREEEDEIELPEKEKKKKKGNERFQWGNLKSGFESIGKKK